MPSGHHHHHRHRKVPSGDETRHDAAEQQPSRNVSATDGDGQHHIGRSESSRRRAHADEEAVRSLAQAASDRVARDGTGTGRRASMHMIGRVLPAVGLELDAGSSSAESRASVSRRMSMHTSSDRRGSPGAVDAAHSAVSPSHQHQGAGDGGDGSAAAAARPSRSSVLNRRAALIEQHRVDTSIDSGNSTSSIDSFHDAEAAETSLASARPASSPVAGARRSAASTHHHHPAEPGVSTRINSASSGDFADSATRPNRKSSGGDNVGSALLPVPSPSSGRHRDALEILAVNPSSPTRASSSRSMGDSPSVANPMPPNSPRASSAGSALVGRPVLSSVRSSLTTSAEVGGGLASSAGTQSSSTYSTARSSSSASASAAAGAILGTGRSTASGSNANAQAESSSASGSPAMPFQIVTLQVR